MSGLNYHIIFTSQGKAKLDEETELMLKNIEHFRRLKGWTHKRVYLMGAAAMIGQDNDNLLSQVAEYMIKGSYGGKSE